MPRMTMKGLSILHGFENTNLNHGIICLNQVRGGCRSPDDDCGQQLPRSATDDAEPAETGMAI